MATVLTRPQSLSSPRRALEEVGRPDLGCDGGAFLESDVDFTRQCQLRDALRVVPHFFLGANEDDGHVGAEMPYFYDPLFPVEVALWIRLRTKVGRKLRC